MTRGRLADSAGVPTFRVVGMRPSSEVSTAPEGDQVVPSDEVVQARRYRNPFEVASRSRANLPPAASVV